MNISCEKLPRYCGVCKAFGYGDFKCIKHSGAPPLIWRRGQVFDQEEREQKANSRENGGKEEKPRCGGQYQPIVQEREKMNNDNVSSTDGKEESSFAEQHPTSARGILDKQHTRLAPPSTTQMYGMTNK